MGQCYQLRRGGRTTFVREENEFYFGHAEFEMSVEHSSGDTE